MNSVLTRRGANHPHMPVPFQLIPTKSREPDCVSALCRTGAKYIASSSWNGTSPAVTSL